VLVFLWPLKQSRQRVVARYLVIRVTDEIRTRGCPESRSGVLDLSTTATIEHYDYVLIKVLTIVLVGMARFELATSRLLS
jgi:hypothetical protein